jgi:hypothetical protein
MVVQTFLNEKGMWQELLHNKYLVLNPLLKFNQSQRIYLSGKALSMVLLLLGWINSSILGGCLARQSPLSKPLYAVVRHKNVRVAKSNTIKYWVY